MASADDDLDAPLTRQHCSAEATKSAASGDLDGAIVWCSRALELLALDEETPRDLQSPAALALYLRRADYALQAARYGAAIADADVIIHNSTEKRAVSKAVRIKCRALLAHDRLSDALSEWQNRLGMGSRVLDELAFRREFGLKGETAEDDDPRYDQALQYLYRRDFGNSISLLNKTIDASKHGKGKSKNKDPVLFLLRARCRIELHEFEGVVADTERVITLLPTAVEAYRWLCEASIALNKHSHASRVCQLGLSIAPQDEALRVLDARLKKSKQERDARLASRRQKTNAVEKEQDMSPNVEEEVEEVEEDAEEDEDPAFEEIRELKRAVKAEPRNADLFARLAAIRFRLRQFDHAQNDAAQAIAVDSTAIAGYLRSCEALYVLRRYAKARRVCEQGLVMVQDATESEMEELRAWESKIEDALVNPPPEEPTACTGPNGKTRVPKAVAARKQQRAQRKVDDAQALRLKCYEKAVDLADDRDFGNAVFWLNKAEGYDAAGRDFYAARICGLRARCRFELKQFDHVAKDAERAIALEPTDAEHYRWLCLSLKARGHADKARAVCASGLAVDPDHIQLLSLMKGLQIRVKK